MPGIFGQLGKIWEGTSLTSSMVAPPVLLIKADRSDWNLRLLSSRRSKQQWLESTWTVQISAKTDQMTHWSINSQRQWQRTTVCRRVVSSRKWFIHEGWMHLLVTHYFAILTKVINILEPDSDADHSPNPIVCFFFLGFPSKNYENIFAAFRAFRTTKSTNKSWPK